MSALQMLDMCVHYIARRHHMLTDEHVQILDEIWGLYEPLELPPLPPSPPPERQHVYFEEEAPANRKRQRQQSWPCDRCLNEEIWECGQCVVPPQEEEKQQEEHQEDCDCSVCSYEDGHEERQQEARKWEEYYENLQQEEARKWQEDEKERQRKLDALWRQVPQGAPVSESITHKETCDCDTCEYEDSEWHRLRRETLADFATLQKEAEYQAQLREEAEEQAEYYREQREEAALWRQVPQGEPVSASMQHKETCGCDTCEVQDRRQVEKDAAEAKEQEQAHWCWREAHERRQERACQEEDAEYLVPRCSDYLPTCDAEHCTYECSEACGSSLPPDEPVGTAYPLPPLESCLYGCAYSCGAKQGQDCIAEFDGEGNQLPPVVEAVVNAAIESDDDMPPLIRMSPIYNPEDETEIVSTAPQAAAPTKPPKTKPIFPYNHPRWPSPRAKALVQWMIRRGRTSKDAISYALKEPGDKSIKTLTHDICMRYLAKYYNLSHEQLLEKSIYTLHNPDRHTPYWHRCPCPFCKGGYMRGYGYGY